MSIVVVVVVVNADVKSSSHIFIFTTFSASRYFSSSFAPHTLRCPGQWQSFLYCAHKQQNKLTNKQTLLLDIQTTGERALILFILPTRSAVSSSIDIDTLRMASNKEYYSSYSEPTKYAHQPLPDQSSTYQSPSSHTPPAVSPFDAPFDDHIYPAEVHRQSSPSIYSQTVYSRQDSNLSQRAADYSNGRQDSNFNQSIGEIERQHSSYGENFRRERSNSSGLGQDTRYYGAGAGGESQSRDDIPLQDKRLPRHVDMIDHVYDADPAMLPRRAPSGRRRQGGWQARFRGRNGNISWVVYILTTIQIAVFIAEIARNAALTGSPIEIHPNFNIMIGPSPYVMINMGARYVVCMHNVQGIQDSNTRISWPCPNTTSTDASANTCTLQELCGFTSTYPVPNPVAGGSIDDRPQPNQWFRFIVPIFMHAGVLHIAANMLLQLTMGREMELAIGPVRFFLVYMASGIFGFILGGNYAATGIASTGASGALFGILALTLLDLLYTWRSRASPVRDLAFIGLDVVGNIVLGLLPGIDNFSHIGGFLMGLPLGICILHSPAALRQRIADDRTGNANYNLVQSVYGASDGDSPDAGVTGFVKSPKTFFQGRKPLWWAWWLIRAGALAGIFIVFVLLLNNFYVGQNTCRWCKYLSCLNVTVGGTNWCDVGNVLSTSTTTTSS